ncbi:hypothetical protein ACTFR8_22750 [Bacillus cereus group sp. MYBK15-3]|uniref:hypothetical protein n=1 Tax=unclassified Bacillus cereus group TaxID=2750818 RepID=UPI003F7B0066
MSKYEGMTLISFEEAVSRFNNNEEVFHVYGDGTEGLCESLEDMKEHHERGGEFGHE